MMHKQEFDGEGGSMKGMKVGPCVASGFVQLEEGGAGGLLGCGVPLQGPSLPD